MLAKYIYAHIVSSVNHQRYVQCLDRVAAHPDCPHWSPVVRDEGSLPVWRLPVWRLPAEVECRHPVEVGSWLRVDIAM